LADENNVSEAELEVENTVPLWRTVVFVFAGLLESLAWLAYGSFLLITGHPRWDAIQLFLVALTWLYTAARPVLRPTATPPYDLLTLYMVHIGGGILRLGGYLFAHNSSGAPLPGTLVLVGLSVNLAILVGLVAVIMGMPLALPSRLVKKENIVSRSLSLEDKLGLFFLGIECFARGLHHPLGLGDVHLGLPSGQAGASYLAPCTLNIDFLPGTEHDFERKGRLELESQHPVSPPLPQIRHPTVSYIRRRTRKGSLRCYQAKNLAGEALGCQFI
jgi:hypothetical protein